MTLDLLVRAGLPDDVAVECRRERSRCGASGRILAMSTLKAGAVIDAHPEALVRRGVVLLALAACVLGWFLIAPRK